MKNRTTKELHQMIRSLRKGEKKSLTSYALRNSRQGDIKIVSLFNTLNRMNTYNDLELIQKLKRCNKKQLPNMKLSLFNIILDSLRITGVREYPILQWHQLMDHIEILQRKGFSSLAWKSLNKLRSVAAEYHQLHYSFQALHTSRNINLELGLVPGENFSEDLQKLTGELLTYEKYSTMALKLENYYKQYGSIQSEGFEKMGLELNTVDTGTIAGLSFYPRSFFLNARTIYFRIRKEVDLFYLSALEWLDLFEAYPKIKNLETSYYLHCVMMVNEAALAARNKAKIVQTSRILVQSGHQYYKLLGSLNLCLFSGKGDNDLFNELYKSLEDFSNKERILVLCHKAACLCALENNWSRCLDFTYQGMKQPGNLRLDVQYHLRLLNYHAHSQLDNEQLLPHLQKSFKRFLQFQPKIK
jgi:hypothetical protein